MRSIKQLGIHIPIKEIAGVLLENIQVIGIMLSLIVVLSFGLFLYRNFYTTIIEARAIVVLEGELAQTAVNVTSLQKVEQNLNTKKQLPEYSWNTVNNLFNDNQSPAVETQTPVDEIIQNNPEPITDTDITPRTSF